MSFVQIASQTLASSTAVVTFSSIPNTYRDLVCVVRANTTGSATALLRFNNSTSSINVRRNRLSANSSSVTSASTDTSGGVELTYTSRATMPNTLGEANFLFELYDYATTNKYKIVLVRGNRSTTGMDAMAGMWQTTNAIDRLDFLLSTGSYGAGSIFTIYGITS